MNNNYGIDVEKLKEEQIERVKSNMSELENFLNEGDYINAFLQLRKGPETDMLEAYIESLLGRKVDNILGEDNYRLIMIGDKALFTNDRFNISFPMGRSSLEIRLFNKEMYMVEKRIKLRGIAKMDYHIDYEELKIAEKEFIKRAKEELSEFVEAGWRLSMEDEAI